MRRWILPFGACLGLSLIWALRPAGAPSEELPSGAESGFHLEAPEPERLRDSVSSAPSGTFLNTDSGSRPWAEAFAQESKESADALSVRR